MAKDYRPIPLPGPKIGERRRDRSRPVPLDPTVIKRKQLIAQTLLQQINPISQRLKQMTDEQRKAVFLKLEHEGPLKLTGTNLKPIATPSESITLAVPKADSLAPMVSKIEAFRDGIPDQFNQLPHGALANNLKQIAWGNPKDRLSPDFLKRYSELTRRAYVVYEIELVTLQTGSKQGPETLKALRTEIAQALARDQPYGQIFEHQDAKGSCRVVIRSSGKALKDFVEAPQWQLKIFYFERRPQFQTFSETIEKHSQKKLGKILSPTKDAATVCIIDSGVSIVNPFLKQVARPELLKSYLKKAPNDPSDQYGHGTGVSSLTAFYALDISEGAENQGKVWIAAARVLDEDNYSEEDKDKDEGRLFSEVIRETVEYFAPLGVRIFNLSVNDRTKSWVTSNKKAFPRSSWVARTIDILSRKHDVVFVVSTGNLTLDHVRSYLNSDIQYPNYLFEGESKVLDPGQAALALTVGSIVHSNTVSGPYSAGDQAMGKLTFPSPFTRSGPGISGEIKPELVERGGNYILTASGGVTTNIGTNVLMASNSSAPSICHKAGTSFAAPRVAHTAGLILSELTEMGITPSAPLIRAFCVNGAAYVDPVMHKAFLAELTDAQRESWINVLGHGTPDARRSLDADPYSAVLYYQGNLAPDKVAFLRFPVPKELSKSQPGKKRLTVTLAFSPEVQRWGLERYLGTIFKWRMFRGDINEAAVVNAMSVEDETDDSYREKLEQELPCYPGINLRSRGTVQHASFEWDAHSVSHSQHDYTLALSTFERWGSSTQEEIPYGVVVRLEDLTQSVQVNALIQARLQARVET
jgi:hypothetical protein